MEGETLSAVTLKQALWKTLRGVRDASVDAKQAQAVSAAAREIVRVSRLQIAVAEAAHRDVPADLVSFSER